MPPMRIVFMGTAGLACASLAALARQPQLQVLAVVTRPDRRQGRDLLLRPSPVKALALQERLPVLQPERARETAFLDQLTALQPDLIVVAAYGQLLPPPILQLPPFGCLNVHTSLLPKYRGAAPIQWALLEGERETGVTIMKMDTGLDTGDILAQQSTVIGPEDNAQTLHDRLAEAGAHLLVRTIPDYLAGNVTPRPQPAIGVSHTRKLTKEDGRLVWSQPARTLWNRVRALNPWPVAFTAQPAVSGGGLLKIWQAAVEESGAGQPGEILQADKAGLVVACGQGALRILELQREGGRRLSAREFLSGSSLRAGQQLH